MNDNTNREDLLEESVKEKVRELRLLQYPKSYVGKTLQHMFNKTQQDVWLRCAKNTMSRCVGTLDGSSL